MKNSLSSKSMPCAVWSRFQPSRASTGLVGVVGALVASLLTQPAQAIDFGPFSLTGFAKVEVQQASNQCVDCQRFPAEDRQRLWADELVPGRPYGAQTGHVTLFQPWLSAKFDLGKGVKLSGLLSQRLRDGKVDIPGVLYERNLALSHEDWGRLAVGPGPRGPGLWATTHLAPPWASRMPGLPVGPDTD